MPAFPCYATNAPRWCRARPSSLSLSAAIDRMLLGEGGFVLLGGEPGVGKTRLAREAQRLGPRADVWS